MLISKHGWEVVWEWQDKVSEEDHIQMPNRKFNDQEIKINKIHS